MILIVSFIEFIMGSLLHFAYDLFPNFLVSIIAPINESIFEHLKLAFFPMLIIGMIIIFTRYELNDQTMTALLIGLITSVLSILLIYYFYRYGLGIESVIVDIILLFVSILLGNLMSQHVYQGVFVIDKWVVIGIILAMIIGFIYLTYFPLNLPMFISSV